MVNAASFDDNLALAVEELSEEVRGLKRQIRINKNWRTALASLMVLKAITIIVLVVLFVNLNHTQDREQVTRSQVLCPLYGLFVQSVDAPQAPNESNAQFLQRVAARGQIHDSYRALGCQPPLK